ncbi:MAG: glutathione S-transferase N-terminal domain-containing protein [Arenimonas sp.]|nr:glutathione S-transferase N-terminal domain-containing protein [Arenimonas sp.]
MTPAIPLLFTFRRCPYAIRARLALASAGIDCTIFEVDLKNKPDRLLAISPKGTVPVLVLSDGRVLEQSLDIMHWALEKNDPDGLLTENAAVRHFTDDLTAQNDGAFKQALDRCKYPGRYGLSDGGAFRSQATEILLQWDVHLKETGFFINERPCLADYALLPFVRQFAVTLPAYFEGLQTPSLQRWLADLTGSALFKRVMAKS